MKTYHRALLLSLLALSTLSSAALAEERNRAHLVRFVSITYVSDTKGAFATVLTHKDEGEIFLPDFLVHEFGLEKGQMLTITTDRSRLVELDRLDRAGKSTEALCSRRSDSIVRPCPPLPIRLGEVAK